MTIRSASTMGSCQHPGCSIHCLDTDRILSPMTTIRTDDPRDLLPSEYEDPWPPSEGNEIEKSSGSLIRKIWKTVPSAAETESEP